MSYSPNVPYLAHWGEGGGSGGVGSQEAGAGPHFLLQNFFSYFPPLKPRCVLWSAACHSPKIMVITKISHKIYKNKPKVVMYNEKYNTL